MRPGTLKISLRERKIEYKDSVVEKSCCFIAPLSGSIRQKRFSLMTNLNDKHL
jgi:hypothetical protein